MPAGVPWWKLTRNRYGRRVYETLRRVGITASALYRYRRALDDGRALPEPVPPEGVRLETRPPGAVPRGRFYGAEDAEPQDRTAVAVTDDGVVGSVLVSDRPVYVAPLGREFRPEGAYVWRLHVRPAYRERGIATALVARSLTVARDRFDAEHASALIAVDNRPSQWTFEANGFEPVARLAYYGLLRLERRTERPVE